MASQLPGARAAIADNQGLPTPEFYRFLLGLQRISAGSATSAEIAALQTQITAIQSEIDGLPKSSFPTLQVAVPVYSQGLLQNGFAKIGVNVADSVVVNGTALQLDGDAAAPGNTYLYSTGLTGTKGWNALSGMLHQSANVAVTFGTDGTATFDLAPLTDSGAGTFKLITRDSYGRLAGTKAGTTSDVPEGTNLYFTASRVLAAVLAGLSTATSAVITASDSVLSALGKLQAQILNKMDDAAVAANAASNATQSIASGVLQKVLLASEIYDSGFYDPSTSRFTPTKAGKYMVIGLVAFTPNVPSGNRVAIATMKNGVLAGSMNAATSNQLTNSVQYSTVVDMNGTTDYLELYARQDAAATMTITGDSSTSMTVFRIGK